METREIGDCLDRLSAALTRLDHEAVSRCAAELEDVRGQVAPHLLSGADAAVLLFRVRHAAQLTASAERLYAGWRQMASPAGTAYTVEGRATSEPHSGNLELDV